MPNIPVTVEIKNLLDADNLAQSKAALDALGAATKGEIVAADLATNAVTEDKILAGAVTLAKITGLGTAATADTSTTGGANKVPLLDSNGTLRLGPVNPTDNQPTQSLLIPAFQRTLYESKLGTSAAQTYLIANHSATLGNDIGFGAGVFPELFNGSPRHCFYWDEGFQMGNAENNRSYGRYLYFRALGNASSPDPVRQSVPTFWNGQNWNGGSTVSSNMGLQWVPGTTSTSGEFVFAITPTFSAGGTVNALTNGVLTSVAGAVVPFSLTAAGPKVGNGKVLTFGDGSTVASRSDIAALAVASVPTIPSVRAASGAMAAGTVTFTPTSGSVTSYTQVFVTRKTIAGTIGNLTYAKTLGTPGAIVVNSSSNTETSVVTYHAVEGSSDSAPPVITGNNAVTDVLTASNLGGSLQWFSNGVAVAGQTSATYVIRHEDIGLPITVKENGVVSNAITAWHPDDESGYFADYRADAGVLKTGGSAAVHGEAVATWQDQSGNSRHLVQATGANQPLLDTTTTPGYPFADFDVTNDSLAFSATITRPYSVFIVGAFKSVNANKRIFSAGVSGSRMYVENTFGDAVKNVDATTGNSAITLNTRQLITARTTSAVNAVRVDSGSEFTVATGTTASGTELVISQSATGGGADVRANAMLVYTADLDSAAQIRVRKYLKAKWGTP